MMTSKTSLDLIVDINLTKCFLISIKEIKNIIIITHSTLANCNPPEILTSMLSSKVSSIMKNSNDSVELQSWFTERKFSEIQPSSRYCVVL